MIDITKKWSKHDIYKWKECGLKNLAGIFVSFACKRKLYKRDIYIQYIHIYESNYWLILFAAP